MMTAKEQHAVSVVDALRQGSTPRGFWETRTLALAAAVTGPFGLVADMNFYMAMSTVGLALWAVSILLTIVAAALATWNGDRVFVKVVFVAVVAGYMATATYDAFRVSGMSAGYIEMDEAMDFGLRLSGQMAPGPGHGDHDAPHADRHGESEGSGGRVATVVLGYAWHYWSGIMFSLAFLVFFGAGRWWLAIPYLLLVIYPGMVFAMGSHSWANFAWEAVGHAGFGATLAIAGYALLGPNAPPLGQVSGKA